MKARINSYPPVTVLLRRRFGAHLSRVIVASENNLDCEVSPPAFGAA